MLQFSISGIHWRGSEAGLVSKMLRCVGGLRYALSSGVAAKVCIPPHTLNCVNDSFCIEDTVSVVFTVAH